MLKKIIILPVFVLIFGFCIMAGSDNDPHPFIASVTACAECHRAKKISVDIKDTENSCSYLCLTCHKDMDRHHAINVRLKEGVPEQFVLTSKSRLACITCHRLKTKRYDTSSWKAESLYENIFNSKKTYKTYYLVTRNNEGQLCKACH